MSKKGKLVSDRIAVYSYELDGPLSDAIKHLTSIRDRVTEQGGNSDDIMMHVIGEDIDIEVSFNRPETEKERAARLKENKRIREFKLKRKEQEEANELYELTRLAHKHKVKILKE